MKRKSTYILILVFMCMIALCPVYADESDLPLNTDDLKNKKDDYSSLTDINGLNLFTNEMQEAISKEESKQLQETEKNLNILFTNQKEDVNEQTISLFTSPIAFDKTTQGSSLVFPLNSFIFVCTVLLGCSVFLITRQYYKRKGEDMNEVNFDIYK